MKYSKNIFNLASTSLLFLILILANNSNANNFIAITMKFTLIAISIIGFLYFIITIIQYNRIDKNIAKLLLFFLFFSVFYFINNINHELLGYERSFQILSVFGIIYIFYKIGIKGLSARLIIAANNIIFILVLIYTIDSILSLQFSMYSGFLLNPNGFGMWFVLLLPYILASDKAALRKLISCTLIIYLIYISSSRTSLLAAFSMLTIYYFNFGLFKKNIYKLALLTIIASFSFLVIYITISFDLSIYNDVIRETTSKNLTSGRHIIWPTIYEYILYKPIFGHGSSVSLHQLFNINLSSHNLFLQIMLQAGYIGLFLCILLILNVFYFIFKINNSNNFLPVLSGFFGLIIIQSFEITLLQNNLALSYPFWALLGLVYGNYKLSKTNEKNPFPPPSPA